MEFDDVIHDEANHGKLRGRRSPLRDHAKSTGEHGDPALSGWRGESLGGVASPKTVLSMQRLAGNAAVVQMLSQTDLETDSEEAGGSDRSPVLDVVGRGGGQPLDERTRASMEDSLDADLSDVRIHQDSAAAKSAEAVQAHAYTVGNEVVFQDGLYQPDTPAGKRMLAHELTHVVQQRNGPVEGTATGDGIAVSHPDDKFEQAAEANADRIMSAGDHAPAAHSGGLATAGHSGPAVAQRDADLDEEQAEAQEDLAQAEEEVAQVDEQEAEEAEET